MVNPPPPEPNDGPLEAKAASSEERERDLLRELRELSGRPGPGTPDATDSPDDVSAPTEKKRSSQ